MCEICHETYKTRVKSVRSDQKVRKNMRRWHPHVTYDVTHAKSDVMIFGFQFLSKIIDFMTRLVHWPVDKNSSIMITFASSSNKLVFCTNRFTHIHTYYTHHAYTQISFVGSRQRTANSEQQHAKQKTTFESFGQQRHTTTTEQWWWKCFKISKIVWLTDFLIGVWCVHVL